jgi:hypothetical protein
MKGDSVHKQGLIPFQTVYNGYLYIGKKLQIIHPSIEETIFVIANKEHQVRLTKAEALKLANIIIENYSKT